MKNFPLLWEAHLQKISDFLLPGKGVWWSENENSIEFYDTAGNLEQRPE